MPDPKRFNQGDPLSAKEFNKIIRELKRIGQLLDAGNPGPKCLRLDQCIFGKIVDAGPESEADYTDCRYWVERSSIDLDETDAETEKVEFVALTTGDYREKVFTATNLAEIVSDSHRLSVDTNVFVLKFYDTGDPSTPRYFMWQTPTNFLLFPVDVSQTGGSAGSISTKCSFIYTATDILTEVSLGTSLSPQYDGRTAKGVYVAGTKGTGYYDETGTFVLWQVNEVFSLEDC